MAVNGRPTTFVTGAAGFIGTELVKVLRGRGHQVFGLTRSLEAAKSDPIRMHEFAGMFARLATRPLRVCPVAATRLVLGPVLADDIHADAVFSNIRLRGIGFRFQYPTLEEGLQQVLGALHE